VIPRSPFQRSLADVVRARHSTRGFLPTQAVPRAILIEALKLAQLAPSNSNIQPWHFDIVEGQSRERLCSSLHEEARVHPKVVAQLPPSFRARRFELGTSVYGAMGIERDDKDGRLAAQMRNYSGFDAPTIGIISIHRELGPVDMMSVGMWLQTFILALTERGVQSCVQAALATHSDVVSRVLDLPADRSVLCGIAIGYEDPLFKANHIHTPRGDYQEHVRFVDDEAVQPKKVRETSTDDQ
jgi:nitroreductase